MYETTEALFRSNDAPAATGNGKGLPCVPWGGTEDLPAVIWHEQRARTRDPRHPRHPHPAPRAPDPSPHPALLSLLSAAHVLPATPLRPVAVPPPAATYGTPCSLLHARATWLQGPREPRAWPRQRPDGLTAPRGMCLCQPVGLDDMYAVIDRGAGNGGGKTQLVRRAACHRCQMPPRHCSTTHTRGPRRSVVLVRSSTPCHRRRAHPFLTVIVAATRTHTQWCCTWRALRAAMWPVQQEVFARDV